MGDTRRIKEVCTKSLRPSLRPSLSLRPIRRNNLMKHENITLRIRKGINRTKYTKIEFRDHEIMSIPRSMILQSNSPSLTDFKPQNF